MNQIPKATKRALLLLALLAPTALAALFTNGGFETGDFTGWTKSTFINNGLSGSPPFTGANIVRTPGGTDQTVTVTAAAPETGVDPRLGPAATLKFPKFGSFSARVNGPTTGRISNTIKQQTTTTPSDVDPSDSRVHVRFAYAPVLENPTGHTESEQPFFYVALRNVTRGNAILYESLNFSNQAGVPWKTSPASAGVLYTDWQIVDIAPGSPALQVGDTVELEVTAADCSLGGHYGYVYVDGFGSQIPGLSVTKTATPSSVARGGQLTYNFIYRNSGSSAVSNVVVKETIPADTSFVSVSDTTACSHASGIVTCNFGTMNPGDQGTFSIVVAVSANPAGASINNGNYTIEGTGVAATLGPLVTTPIQPLSISKTPSAPVALPGGNLRYDFTYRNSGANAVSNVIVQETLPADTTFVSVSDTTACSHASGTVTCNFGTMSPGAQGTFSIVVAVSANPTGTSIVNGNYTIQGTGVPATPGSTVTTPIQALAISKTPSAPFVLPGGNLQYDFTYRNPGGTTVSNVVVQETIPADTTFVSVSDTTACSHASGTVTCNFGTMSPGAQGTFSIVVAVSANPTGTSIVNGNYTIQGTGVPATPGPPVTTPMPVLSISKTPSAAQGIFPGARLQYDFIYTNSGTAAANDVIVSETIPSQTTFVSVSNPTVCSYSSGVVTCNFGTLNAGASGTFSVVVRVAPETTGSIVNGTYSIAATGISPVAGEAVTVPVVLPIPTISSLGMLALATLLALAGYLLLLKRRRAG